MRRTLLVAGREYFENVKTKSFWFGIMLVPILYGAMFLIPQLLDKTKGATKYAVIDKSDWLLPALDRRIAAQDLGQILTNMANRHQADADSKAPDLFAPLIPQLSSLTPAQTLALAQSLCNGGTDKKADLPDPLRSFAVENAATVQSWLARGPESGDGEGLWEGTSVRRYTQIKGLQGRSREALNRMIADEELFAYFVIGEDPLQDSSNCEYICKNLTDRDLLRWFTELASQEVRERRLAREEIDPTVAGWIQAPLSFAGLKVGKDGQSKTVEAQDKAAQMAPVVFVYLLWLTVFMATQMLLTSMVVEKSNRLIEVLLSSISPIELMSGKVAGIAATGITVVGTWVVAAVIGVRWLPQVTGMSLDIDLAAIAVNPLFLGSFLAYFVMGYLFYAAVLAGIGSVCSSLKEAQNIMVPVTMLLFVPLLLMIPIVRDPNSLLAQICSFIPPLTPFVMMNRAALPPTPLEYGLTTALMLVSICLAFWGAAKIFRIGILLTGKPPKLREMLRWIRTPVGAIPQRPDLQPSKQ